MNITKCKWICVVFAWLVGLAMGILLSIYFFDSQSRKAFGIYLDNYLSLEENEALDKFKETPPIIAIYAQDRLIKYATSLKELGVLKKDNYARIVGIAEARKGLLYETVGENQKSSQCFNNAVEKFKEGNIRTNIDELRLLLNKTRRSRN